MKIWNNCGGTFSKRVEIHFACLRAKVCNRKSDSNTNKMRAKAAVARDRLRCENFHADVESKIIPHVICFQGFVHNSCGCFEDALVICCESVKLKSPGCAQCCRALCMQIEKKRLIQSDVYKIPSNKFDASTQTEPTFMNNAVRPHFHLYCLINAVQRLRCYIYLRRLFIFMYHAKFIIAE